MKPIAIIEDNPGDRELMESVLESIPPGDNFEFFENAEDFMGELKNDKSIPKLLVLDLNLPGESGFSVLEQIKKLNLTYHLSIVVLSTSQSDNDIKKSYELGANSYLAKPLSYNDFKGVVQNLVEFFTKYNLSL